MKVKIIFLDITERGVLRNFTSLKKQELLSAIQKKYNCSKYLSEQAYKELKPYLKEPPKCYKCKFEYEKEHRFCPNCGTCLS